MLQLPQYLRDNQPQSHTYVNPVYREMGLHWAWLGDPSGNELLTGVGRSSQAGTPKTQVGPTGLVSGFGTTSGTGTTDSFLLPGYTSSDSVTWIVHYLLNSATAGGGLGRIVHGGINDSNTATEGIFVVNGSAGVSYLTGSGQWVSNSNAITLGVWHSFVVRKSGAGTTPTIYVDSVSAFGTQLAPGDIGAVALTPRIGNRPDTLRGLDGMVGPCYRFNSVLTDEEVFKILDAPYRVVAPYQSRIYSIGSSTGSTGTSSTTNSNDTSSASGTTTVVGTLSRTNANDTSSASGTTTVLGTSNTTNANDTSSASGSVGSAGSSGTSATTNSNDTSSAAGTTTIVGTAGIQAGNDTSSITATTTIIGTISYQNANDTSTASGTIPGTDSDNILLILKILSNKQTLDPDTGLFTLYDDDDTTILYQVNAWEDAAGTIPYRGRSLARIDQLV